MNNSTRFTYSGIVLLEKARGLFDKDEHSAQGITVTKECIEFLTNGIKHLSEQPAEQPDEDERSKLAGEQDAASKPAGGVILKASPTPEKLESKDGAGVVSEQEKSESKPDAGVVSKPEKSQNVDGSGIS